MQITLHVVPCMELIDYKNDSETKTGHPIALCMTLTGFQIDNLHARLTLESFALIYQFIVM